MLPDAHLIDAIGTSYLDLLAAAAGCTIARPSRDYGVDGTLQPIERWFAGGYVPNAPSLDFQLKTTTRWEAVGDAVLVEVPVRAYNLVKRRAGGIAPVVLIIICLEPDDSRRLMFSSDQVSIGGSAFWWGEAGPGSANTRSVSLRIPATNALTPAALRDMLKAENRRLK